MSADDMTDIELGLAIHWTDQTFDDMVALAEAGERLGYGQLWVANEKFFHDMHVTAGVVAERTARPAIGTFVSDPYTLHPALTAMAAATLDEVSGGRAMIGMGAGGTGFPEMGIARLRPAQAIKAAVLLIRRLLGGGRVDFHGEVVHFNDGRLNIEARPDIPLIVASRGDLVLQTAGEVADRVMIATYAEPRGLRHAKAMIGKGAERAGRSLADVPLISRIDTCIDDDRRAAYDAVKPGIGVSLWTSYPDRKFADRVGLRVPDDLEAIIAERDYNLMAENAHLIPDAFVDKFCWAGTARDVAAKVAAVIGEGVAGLTIMPLPAPGSTRIEVARAFAEDVVPRARQMARG